MKKTAWFLFLALIFISFTNSIAQASNHFDVRTNLIGFTPGQENKIRSASGLIRKIVRSKEFKDRVLTHTWKGKKQFAENGGLSNTEIYQKILEGQEKMTSFGVNHTMDLEVELYTDYDSITIGYTYPSIVRIYMNRKYFNKFRPYQVADNMTHEWLHKIGFVHPLKATPERPYSVPYAVGYIVKGIAREMKESHLTKGLHMVAEQTLSHD